MQQKMAQAMVDNEFFRFLQLINARFDQLRETNQTLRKHVAHLNLENED